MTQSLTGLKRPFDAIDNGSPPQKPQESNSSGLQSSESPSGTPSSSNHPSASQRVGGMKSSAVRAAKCIKEGPSSQISKDSGIIDDAISSGQQDSHHVNASRRESASKPKGNIPLSKPFGCIKAIQTNSYNFEQQDQTAAADGSAEEQTEKPSTGLKSLILVAERDKTSPAPQNTGHTTTPTGEHLSVHSKDNLSTVSTPLNGTDAMDISSSSPSGVCTATTSSNSVFPATPENLTTHNQPHLTMNVDANASALRPGPANNAVVVPAPANSAPVCSSALNKYLKQVIAIVKRRQIKWTCEDRNKIETTSQSFSQSLVLEGGRISHTHMREISEKALRLISNYRDLCGVGKLEWCDHLYEICVTGNNDMIGSKQLDDFNPRIGVKAVRAVLRISMKGRGVESRKKGFIGERVSRAVLLELKKRAVHCKRILNNFMRYGAVDIFGTEEDFVVNVILARYPPYTFNASKKDYEKEDRNKLVESLTGKQTE